MSKEINSIWPGVLSFKHLLRSKSYFKKLYFTINADFKNSVSVYLMNLLLLLCLLELSFKNHNLIQGETGHYADMLINDTEESEI